MEQYKAEFIEFMVESGVLTFGDFVTKSGRPTPYFMNAGLYRTGDHLRRLGEFYADAVIQAGYLDDGVDVLFGPAYKGIPLVATTAIALSRRGHDVAYAFNRKEAKLHGEGGVLVGHSPVDGDRVLIIEDVTTAGTSIRETVPILQAAAAITLAGLVVSLDRGERSPDAATSALATVGDEFSMSTSSIVTVHEVIEHLHGRELGGSVVIDDTTRERMQAHLATWGPTV